MVKSNKIDKSTEIPNVNPTQSTTTKEACEAFCQNSLSNISVNKLNKSGVPSTNKSRLSLSAMASSHLSGLSSMSESISFQSVDGSKTKQDGSPTLSQLTSQHLNKFQQPSIPKFPNPFGGSLKTSAELKDKPAWPNFQFSINKVNESKPDSCLEGASRKVALAPSLSQQSAVVKKTPPSKVRRSEELRTPSPEIDLTTALLSAVTISGQKSEVKPVSPVNETNYDKTPNLLVDMNHHKSPLTTSQVSALGCVISQRFVLHNLKKCELHKSVHTAVADKVQQSVDGFDFSTPSPDDIVLKAQRAANIHHHPHQPAEKTSLQL